MERNITLPPDPARVMEGLRDTGYNFNTAAADIIDNSIAAKATKVDISINLDVAQNITVLFADNGCGMNEEELLNAMKIKWLAHFPSASTLNFPALSRLM